MKLGGSLNVFQRQQAVKLTLSGLLHILRHEFYAPRTSTVQQAFQKGTLTDNIGVLNKELSSDLVSIFS
jgi:hypothetical protein